MKKFYVLLAALVAVLVMATPANAAKSGGGGVTPNISVACPNFALCLYTDSSFNGSMYYFLSGPAVQYGACTTLPPGYGNAISSYINLRGQYFKLYDNSNCTGGVLDILPVESDSYIGGVDFFNDRASSVWAGGTQ